MKNIRVIAAGIAAAGFISCTVTTHGTSQAAAEGDFAGRNAPYYYHAEGFKPQTEKGHMQAGIACYGPPIPAESSYAPPYYEIAEILLETDPQRAVAYSQTANALDTANLAYQNGSLMAESLGVAQFYTGFVCSAVEQDRNRRLAKMLGISGKIRAGMALGIPAFRYPNYIDRKDINVTKL